MVSLSFTTDNRHPHLFTISSFENLCKAATPTGLSRAPKLAHTVYLSRLLKSLNVFLHISRGFQRSTATSVLVEINSKIIFRRMCKPSPLD